MINVLIAEDDFRVAQIHEEFLAKNKQMKLIGKATNAKETFQQLKEHKVDLLLLDVYMPDELGTELLHSLRSDFPEVDIIMITAAKEKSFLEKALKYGIQDYLIKPVTMEKFHKALENYCQKRRTLQSASEVDQEVLDMYFGSKKKVSEKKNDLPPGIDYLTLNKISKLLANEKDGITSERVGEKIGASRTTARRYLEYLVGMEEATIEQVYGIVGRPERRYCMKK
ncbi:CitB family two-component system response regulator CitT [Bacillus pakistanensis]|uniref:CitB family two-component system response regulator CitT n=1 Tax=Rossellomorea pakistanensis TaxID=992288 RepID=A0ABS2NCU0_9BACI|nr:response regulator [Bacillus pakistanensis]MBM7585638.1 CitB family two-component system response regulator CitT [Bacillus pakistanensis]